VLILVAVDEHRARIEVGYGLEGFLTDGVCGEIIRTEMLPAFRREFAVAASLIWIFSSMIVIAVTKASRCI